MSCTSTIRPVFRLSLLGSIVLSCVALVCGFVSADESVSGFSSLVPSEEFTNIEGATIRTGEFDWEAQGADEFSGEDPGNQTLRNSVDAKSNLLFRETSPNEVFDGHRNFNAEDAEFPPQEDGDFLVPPRPQAPPRVSSDAAEIHSLKETDDLRKGFSFYKLAKEPYTNYRVDQSSWSWLPGSGENFGWLSFQGSTYEPRGKKTGFGGNFGIHLLGGPISSPVPPRLYDFAFGFQTRDSLSDRFSYDLATSVGIFSDFEGSARDGVRFPSHAVGMVHINSTTDLVFGVDYLGRDDVAVLPVFGVSLHDHHIPGLRYDLIFPRPRIDYVLTDDWRGYLSANMDGGTWDIQFPNGTGQVMTYRDFRLVLGFEHADKDSGLSAWEFGYVFGRELEYRNNPNSTRFEDAFVLQWVWRR